MGKVIYKGMAGPGHPIYKGELMVGARLTEPPKAADAKDKKKLKNEVTSKDSPEGKQTLLELALSKGFTIADPDDPIYKEGLIIQVNPFSSERKKAKKGTKVEKKPPRSRKGK
jgi:hypothetical protein